MKKNYLSLNKLRNKMIKSILEISYNSGEAAHIGGALSIVDILAVLYNNIISINLKKPKDRFILSKGHGFLGLLSILYCMKFINKNKLMTFQKDGSDLIAHPIENSELGIESSNGSLGQGLSLGIGLALSYKKKNKENSIYVLVGDGECYEGSVWEAAIAATEIKLDNLIVIVDCNGYQNDGAIGSKMDFKNLRKKWQGFGWHTVTCNGHNFKEIEKALRARRKDKPVAVIAKTVKGSGVSFMEKNNDWHHGRLTKKLFQDAFKKL